MAAQTVVASRGFYHVTDTLPPRFLLLIAPAMLTVVLLMTTSRGRAWMRLMRPERLTLLHTVRVPVELTLWLLAGYGAIPTLMTFEGRNWDILAGLTAPIVYYLYFKRQTLSRRSFVLWNVVSLATLANIVGHAILSAPSPFQKLAFDRPNIAIQYVPYVWLPSLVVPVVLFAHLASLSITRRTDQANLHAE